MAVISSAESTDEALVAQARAGKAPASARLSSCSPVTRRCNRSASAEARRSGHSTFTYCCPASIVEIAASPPVWPLPSRCSWAGAARQSPSAYRIQSMPMVAAGRG